jgi:putative ABC transport system permease protein
VYRTLIKRPGFTTVAVTTLAVGIAATTTVFTCVNALLIRGLPVHDPEQIISIFRGDTARGSDWFLSYPDFEDWRDAAASFSDLGAFNLSAWAMNVSDEGRPPERADGYWITANTFRLLGQRPLIGRDFAPSDDHKGADPVVILGYSLWQTKLLTMSVNTLSDTDADPGHQWAAIGRPTVARIAAIRHLRSYTP